MKHLLIGTPWTSVWCGLNVWHGDSYNTTISADDTTCRDCLTAFMREGWAREPVTARCSEGCGEYVNQRGARCVGCELLYSHA